jgi:molecular chaperone GrpE
MTHWDPYRRPPADEAYELRRALVETRRIAEQALTERDAALHALREAAAAPVEAPSDAELRASRLAADLANVRRNRDDEIARARAEERANGLSALASVQDDLQRSLDANPDRDSAWYRGHEAILARVRAAIRAAGGVEVGRVGERFDPTVHDAVGIGPGPSGTIVSVERPGLVLDDGKLVRAAQVRVAP